MNGQKTGERIRRVTGLLIVAVPVSLVSCREVQVTAVDVSTVIVDAPVTRLAVGESAVFTARVRDRAGRELNRAVTWTSSAPSIATVSSDGMVTGRADGEVVIGASVDGRSDEVSLMIGEEPVVEVDVVPLLASMQVGDTLRMRAIARGAGGIELTGRDVTWGSSDPDVASVDANGLVRALAVGGAAVSATVGGVRGQATASVSASLLTVSAVDIEPSTSTLSAGDSVRLVATALASNGAVLTGRRVTWASSSSTVAAVRANGTVKALAQGNAVITATIDGVAGTAALIVTPPTISSLTVTPASTTLVLGATLQLAATIRATDGSEVSGVPVTWSTSDGAVASVSNTGLVSTHAVGTAFIEATGGGVMGSAAVYVVLQPVAAMNISPANPAVFAGDSVLLDANPVDGAGSPLTGRSINWSTGDASIATVLETGPTTQQARLYGMAAGATYVYAESGARRDSTLATVQPRADVVVTKTSPSTQVTAGENVEFSIGVRNDGPSPATNVVVTDTLPSNAAFVDASGGATRSGNVLTWPAIASLASGSSQSFTVRVQAPPSGAITNVAAAVATTAEVDPADNRAAVTVGVDALADLSVAKSASAASVDAGSPIEYTITVRNTGLGDAAGVVVTDTLPANAAFVSASGGPAVTGGVLTWTVGTIAAADSRTFDVVVTAPRRGTVTNVAAATTSSQEVGPGNNRASVSTTVNAASLSVAKTGPASVAPGSAVTYTIQVRNDGPGTATDVVVTDRLPAAAAFVSATGGVTPDANNTLRWTEPSLASGVVKTYTVEVTAPQSGTLVNEAAVQASTSDPDANDNASSVTTIVAVSDVSVSKSGPASANAGEVITYTLDVTNDGPTSAAGTVLVDSLPSGVTFVSASTPPSSQSGTALVWNLGSLAGGAGTSIDVQVQTPTTAATLTNVARVSSTTVDPDPSDNRDEVSTTVVASADLAVTASGQPAQTNPGGSVTYSIQVTNNGPSAAAGVTVTSQLPAGATFVNANRGGTESGGVVTWPSIGMPSGRNESYSVTVNAPSSAGTHTNTVSVTSSTNDPVGANNTAAVQTLVMQADVSVTKSGPANATAADTVSYTIMVSNAGPSAASDVVVTDALPGNATFVDATPAGSSSGGGLTWTIPSLAASSQRTFTVRVVGPANGASMTNSASVTSSTFDPQPGNNDDSATTDVSPAANLRVTKTAASSQVDAGATIAYAVNLENLGPSAASGVTLTDDLPGNATFLDASGGPSRSGNRLTWDVGSLGAGGSRSYTVRVTAPASGSVRNEASASASTPDPASGNNSGAATVNVRPADIAVAVRAPTSVSAGANITYTVVARNLGPGAAVGVSLQSTVPTNTTYIDHSAGTHDPATGVITLTAATLAAGDSISFDVTVTAPLTGSVESSGGASSTSADPDSGNDTASATTSVNVLAADLAVTVTAAQATAPVGGTIEFTVTATNNGPGPAVSAAVTVSLPPSTSATFIDATDGYTKVGDLLLWSSLGIAAGDSVSFTVRMTADVAGAMTVSATVGSLSPDPDGSNNSDADTTTAG